MNRANVFVPDARCIAIVHRLLLRSLVTKGRVVALLVVGILVGVVVAAVARANAADLSAIAFLELGVDLMTTLGLILVVPIVSLVFASAAFGDLREDATLVYLWLRPMNRWPIVVGAWLAVVTVSLPLILFPLTSAALIANVDVSLVSSTVLACVVGNLAYSAVFVLLGLLTKNAVSWGVGYVLIWEGLIAELGSFGERLAIRGYTRSIFSGITDVNLSTGNYSLLVAILVPAIVVVVALWLSSRRLSSLDVA